MEEKNDSLQLI